jgi:uridylate kinase
MNKLWVISLGGSLIIPDEINSQFLKGFKQLIIDRVKKGERFIIITGGGSLCRKYNSALNKITKPTAEDLDWMGISVTWTNAKLIQLMFGNLAHPNIATNPLRQGIFKEKILVGGGWKPGRSSDGATIKYAQSFGAKTVINLSNIDFVYDKDPRKYEHAKKIEKISWKNFIKIIGSKWKPGANLPFDPTAAKLAQKSSIKVIITKGTDLANLKYILAGQPAKGTIIE